MALLHLAHACASRLQLELQAAFVDHGLRDVEPEWALVQQAAQVLGLEVQRLAVPRDEADRAMKKGSVQAWAREVRYGLLGELAQQLGASSVATAHTLNDQAETVMMRLLRGTGLDGLSAMSATRSLGPVRLIRPLLAATRDALREYLVGRGVKWIEDPSNTDRRFMRARVRSELLPLMEQLQPGVAGRLAALAEDAAHQSAYLEQTLDEAALVRPLRLGEGVQVDAATFAELPRGIWGRVIRRALLRVRGDLRRIERSHLLPIEAQLAALGITDVLPLPGTVCAFVDRGSLLVFPAPLPENRTLRAAPQVGADGLGRAALTALGTRVEIRAPQSIPLEQLCLRTRQPGDRLWGSKRRFKAVLVDGKVPKCYRNFIPVLAFGTEIIACPGLVGSRREDLDVHWILDDTAPLRDIGATIGLNDH